MNLKDNTMVFDYDSDKLSGRKALIFGIKLIIFAIKKILKLEPSKEFIKLCDNYAITLIQLNKMLGIKTIIGIKNTMNKQELIEKLKLIDDTIDIREHFHIGNNNNIYRKRFWIPFLNQSYLTWHFEDKYCNNNIPILKNTDYPIFHFDNPEHLSNYIKFIYNRYIDYNGDYIIE